MTNLRTCVFIVLPLTACGPDMVYNPVKDSGESESGARRNGCRPNRGWRHDRWWNHGGEPTDTAEPDESLIGPTNPRLFFSSSDIPGLQARVLEPAQADFVSTWDAAVSGWLSETALPFTNPLEFPSTEDEWTDIADPLPNLAMYSLFTSNTETRPTQPNGLPRSQSKQIGARQTQRIRVEEQAILCRRCVSPMTCCTTNLEDHNALMCAEKSLSRPENCTVPSPAQHHPPGSIIGTAAMPKRRTQLCLLAGLSVERDYDEATQWINHAKRFVESTMDALEGVSDGSWPDGPSLGSDALTPLFASLYLLERHYGTSWTTIHGCRKGAKR